MMNILSILLICVLGVLVYSNTLHSSFHFDDQIYIVNNFAVRNFHHLIAYWKFYPTRFITFLSLCLNYHFNALHVAGYHLFNLAVHLGTAVLVWWFVLLTLATPVMKENKISRHAPLIALFAALLFVSHPLQTEAVTYIWQRTASMGAFFYLASLCLYVKSRLLTAHSAKARCCYIFSILLAVVAMFTKENTVTLPLTVLLYEFSFFEIRHINARLIVFLCTIFIIPATVLLAKSQQFQAIEKFTQDPAGTSPLSYLLTQFRVLCTYIRLLFLPLHQNLDYDYTISKSIFELPVLMSLLFLTGVFFAAARLFSKYRLLSFSIYFFFLTLLLESSVLPLKNIIFEHRLYLPLTGYCIFLAAGMYYLVGKNNIKAMVLLLTLIVALNSWLTYQRNKVWKDELSLWSDAVKKSPRKARSYTNLGFAYKTQGNFTQAIAEYNKAIGLNPELADAYVGRGLSFAQEGNFTDAIADYNKAIEIQPDFEEAYINRGVFYIHQGQLTSAISDLTRAIELEALDAKAYYNRALGYAKQGDTAQAIADYNRAIELDPDYTDAYYNRGLGFAQENYFTGAIFDFNKVIELDPDYADAYNNRGIIYAIQGDLTQAISDFSQALKIKSDDAQARNNLNHAYDLLRAGGDH